MRIRYAFGGADQGQGGSRAAAGVFNDGPSGLQPAVLLRPRNHGLGHAVLHAAGGILPLQFHEDVRAIGGNDLAQPDQCCVSDRLENVHAVIGPSGFIVYAHAFGGQLSGTLILPGGGSNLWLRGRPMDNWVAGEAYERYVGRWSRVVAREFLSWLEVPGRREWLDVGSGTGVLSEAILEIASPLRVKGIDSSAGFIAYARKRIKDSRAYFEVASAQTVPDGSESYDSVVAGLVLEFHPRTRASGP